ncbi:IS1380 family transposase [Bacillus carboniphilus]|uniref:IS1380 family transposase n=1 Tax=Bacillus carboniphilus TaxID=86663 RepID=A0ABY9JPZ2_9BACI|nr:IS1380 family transposase [Bacillus carboniphilus]WLR41464.1 IS1380 family transposase [Bacillus carboniphilus]
MHTMKFILEDSDETLSTHSGLGLIGLLLSKTKVCQRFSDIKIPQIQSAPSINNGNIIKAYIGLLSQSKNDFDPIEPFRNDPFFMRALDMEKVPSSSTLRQRLNQIAKEDGWKNIILEESVQLLKQFDSPVTPTMLKDENGEEKAFVPLDMDVSPFDNSNTKKEGVSRTYKGCDGYAPNFSYLGQEGYIVNVELREGKTHVQKGTDHFLQESIRYAKQITDLPLLIRLDGGNDSADNLKVCDEEKVDFIIKRNPRRENPETWLMIAKERGKEIEAREGKRIFYGSVEATPKKMGKPVRQIYKVVERTIDRNGQILLVPEIEFESYWTSLNIEPEQVIPLYHEHGTCEQFHSELKTDLDLERFPSGKFATNDLILHLGCFVYNLLRIIGQESLKGSDAPLKKKVFRRRIKKVIQNLITIASKMVRHARKVYLKFGKNSPWFHTFRRIYSVFST